MNRLRFLLGGAALALALAAFFFFRAEENYAERPEALEFAERMSSGYGFDPQAVLRMLAAARRQQSALDAIARPVEKNRSWGEYSRSFLSESRIVEGAAFWNAHRETLERAAKTFGAPPEIIVAIIGVESRYGRNLGRYRTLDALATLAFDYPPRADFFRKQLREYFLLARERGFDPLALKSSYAGAMGYGQFLPESYRKYAMDFDADGMADLFDNPADAIGSIGNYLQLHGWRRGAAAIAPARIGEGFDRSLLNRSLRPQMRIAAFRERGLFAEPPAPPAEERAVALAFQGRDGEEYWFGLHNFYVLTRYNPSRLYAMAVLRLGREIRARMAGSAAGAAAAAGGPGR